MNKNLSNNHPIIPNYNDFFFEKRYLSVNSEDRDFTKFPNSSEFEITLPQEYLNVVSVKLVSWAFPSNYSVFSALGPNNVKMSFKLLNLYNPGEHGISDPLLEGIFAALYYNIDKEYIVTIESGFYNPDQMFVELTNRFNEAVSNVITDFFNNNSEYAVAKSLFTGYNRFQVVYNAVSFKLWFGNTTDKFVLTNETSAILTNAIGQSLCSRKYSLPDFYSWGLPAYLGFSRCSAYAYSVAEYKEQLNNTNLLLDIDKSVPRFYYGDAIPGSGDNGYWLLPGAPGATVYFLEAPYKINFMGPDHIYMEIDGMNCVDATVPWDLSEYTAHTNQTNGIVNSFFAKIPVSSTPISQYYDRDALSYKYWNPPAERIFKIKFRFRYHNGQLVSFGQFNYSFMLEFNLINPQQERSYNIRNAFDLAQTQQYSNRARHTLS